MNRTPLTSNGFDQLKEELHLLKTQERPAVIQAISEARAHGDLSENAEYDAAKEKQSMLEGRIQDLENKISTAEIINPTELQREGLFSVFVTFIDLNTDEQFKYQIVGEDEPIYGRENFVCKSNCSGINRENRGRYYGIRYSVRKKRSRL